MRGFTLIEAMVAVTILTLSIAGPMTAANRAVVAAETARDQLSASYLAQEGVEYARAIRDDAYLNEYQTKGETSLAWNKFLTASVLSSCRYQVTCGLGSLQNGTLQLCQGTSCPAFSLVQNAGAQFTRTVQLKNAPCQTGVAESDGSADVCVISKVTWSFHGTPYAVQITDHLTPWQ
jgi:prepilin-type N-terminal cleavage/methylation domain-containing protein